MKKKGYFLIECSIYMWACVIFSAMILNLFLPYIKEFKKCINQSTDYNYMLSASMYIDNIIYSDNVYFILGENNELKIYSNEENLKLNIVKVNNGKLVCEHYRIDNENFYLDTEGNGKLDEKNYKKVATNTILKNVESFKVSFSQNNKVIYVTLKQLGNEERFFCYENKFYK